MDVRNFPIWDYNITADQFQMILNGKLTVGRLNQNWAVTRLFEYESYPAIVQRLGYRKILDFWPKIRDTIRSPSRKRGFDFLVEWIPKRHPEKLEV